MLTIDYLGEAGPTTEFELHYNDSLVGECFVAELTHHIVITFSCFGGVESLPEQIKSELSQSFVGDAEYAKAKWYRANPSLASAMLDYGVDAETYLIQFNKAVAN